MKYLSLNELKTFHCHDAEVGQIILEHEKLICILHNVNVTKENSQNIFLADMCIREAKITFEMAHINKIQCLGYEIYDSNNKRVDSIEGSELPKTEYPNIRNEHLIIQDMEVLQEGTQTQNVACVTIDTGSDIYEVTIFFCDVIITWEDYSGRAWYENSLDV